MSMLFSKIPKGTLTVLSIIIDKSPTKSSSLSAMSRSLISLANQIGCIDPWHFFNPSDKVFSFFSDVHHVYSQIDYFFLDKSMLSSVISSDDSAIVISDHSSHVYWSHAV